MSISNFAEDRLLNYILGTPGGDTSGIRPSPAGLIHIGLFTNADGQTPTYLETNAGTGSLGTNEVSGGSYARQQIIFGSPAANGIISNTNRIDWAVATSGWGTVTHFALINIGISDICGTLFWGQLDTPRTVLAGEKFVIFPGQIKVQLN